MNLRLLTARKAARLTQEQLAAKVGITQADVSRIEVHGWTPPPEVQAKLAAAVDAEPETIFDLRSASHA